MTARTTFRILVVLALVLVVGVVIHQFVVTQQRHALGEQLAAHEREWEEHDAAAGRQLFVEDATDADAWDGYRAALAAVAALGDSVSTTISMLVQDDPLWHDGDFDAVAQRRLRQQLEPSLAGLAAGARARHLRSDVDWSAELDEPSIDVLAVLTLQNAAVLDARWSLADGDSVAARSRLVDVCRFGGDLVRTSPYPLGALTGAVLVDAALEELEREPELLAGSVNASFWRDVVDGLATEMTSAVPRGVFGERIYLERVAYEGRSQMLTPPGLAGGALALVVQYPRHALASGLSPSVMLFEACEAYGRGLDVVSANPKWSRLDAGLATLQADVGPSPSREVLGSLRIVLKSWHGKTAWIRLWRTALHALADGVDPIAGSDSFGRQRWRRRVDDAGGTRLLLWSVGADGVDHGGDVENDLVVELPWPRADDESIEPDPRGGR